MKKFLSLVLVFALALSLSAPALAADLPKAGDRLTGNEKILYDYLVEQYDSLLTENTTSTRYLIPVSRFGIKSVFPASELGYGNTDYKNLTQDDLQSIVNKIAEEIEPKINYVTVLSAIEGDYPEKVYWRALDYDHQTLFTKKPTVKGEGTEWSFEVLPESGYDDIMLQLDVYISADYSKTGKAKTTEVDLNKLKNQPVINAFLNAEQVAEDAKNKSVYDKVATFREYICKQTAYDDYASKYLEEGNSWQIISALDGNEATKVVCAGYAKTFKYLCDLSGVPCYYIEGYVNGDIEMGHAWNIVQMDDGKFYHVDITWCDLDGKGGLAYYDRYFLKGVSGSGNSYTVKYEEYVLPNGQRSDSGSSKYTLYKSQCLDIWGSQLIPSLAASDYVPAKITFNTDGHGTAPDAKIVNYHTAAGELPAPTANGFTFEGWYNGTTEYTADSIIDGPIELTAKWTATTPTTHSVAVNPTANGTATVSKVTATAGEEITVTATPASGYELDSITVTPDTAVANGKFTMPASDVTITVTFKATQAPQPAALTGTVTISGTPKVGETLTAKVTGTNNSGTLSYQWKAGGTVVGTNKTTYQPTAADIGKTITCVVTSSVETGSIVSTPTAAVAAATVPQPTAYNISVNSMTNGTASVSKPTAAAGEEITVTATPANGYELDSITVTPSTTVTNGKFTMPASDVTVTVTFKAVASTPDPEPTPTPDPEPDPEPTPAPNPEPTPEPEPSTPVNPDPGTTPEPSSKPSTPDNTETKQEPKQETKQETTISLNRSRLDLNTGNFGALTAAVTPSGSVTWSSSDTRVVTVDSNGSYFATGAGAATISVAANGKTATCYVTVTDPTFSANYTPYIPSGTQTTQSGTQTNAQTGTQTNTRTPGVGSETTNTTATPTTDVFTTVVDNPDGTRFTVVDNRNGISSIVQKDSYGQLLFESVTYSAAALARSNSVITAPETVIPAYTEAGATEIQFTMPQSSGKQTVRIPVENATDTTVAVAMNMVGPSEPILDSHIEGNYLVFTTNGSATVKVIEGAKYFDDVSSANWFNSAVAWVSSHGVMVGTKANLFSPYANITRAQMAQLLYNLSGASSESVTSQFSDVGGHWYDKSVSWAASNGLVSPQSQGYFGATADATRADMVTALYRYAKANGVNTSARADLSKFSDAATLTGEARDAMSWAVGIGLVNGSTQNNSRTVVLDPQGTVTRAQMATLMMRYCGMFA